MEDDQAMILHEVSSIHELSQCDASVDPPEVKQLAFSAFENRVDCKVSGVYTYDVLFSRNELDLGCRVVKSGCMHYLAY